MKVKYDRETDILYIVFSEKKIKESEEFNDLTKTSVKDIFDGNVLAKKFTSQRIIIRWHKFPKDIYCLSCHILL